MDRTSKVKEKPYASAHKLASYHVANGANERERILRNQKFPSGFIVTRYSEAEIAIRRALLGGGDFRGALAEESKTIGKKSNGSKWYADATLLCTNATESFSKTYPDCGLGGLTVTRMLHRALYQRVEGVRISTRPLVMLSQPTRRGVKHGALLTVMRKEVPLTSISGPIIAALLRSALVHSGLDPADVDPALCIVVDVLHGSVFRAPGRDKRIFSEIQSTCREYAVRWPFIENVKAA